MLADVLIGILEAIVAMILYSIAGLLQAAGAPGAPPGAARSPSSRASSPASAWT